MTTLENRPRTRYALPGTIFFAIFALLPLVGVGVLSFVYWDGLGQISFAGFDNWKRSLTDSVTRNAIWLTAILVVGSYLAQFPVSLLLGTFMAGRERYREVYSILFFLPLLFSAAGIGITFTAILDPNFGIGRALGLDVLSQDWLGRPGLAMVAIILIITWAFVPFHSLLYQAGVRQIPASLYEAATMDGAGKVKQFFMITVPQLRYTIVTSSTLMLVGALTYFDLIFILTEGGPGYSTRVLPLHMYLTGFRSYDMGYASVISVLLIAVGLLMAWALAKLGGTDSKDSLSEGA